MPLPRTLLATAFVALSLPTAAQAAAWSDPVTVPGSTGQAGSPVVLGDAITFNGAGAFPGAPLLRASLGDTGPGQASRWPGATNFYSEFGAFATGDQLLYVGSNGHQRVNVGLASDASSPWRVSLRGPSTGGARSAVAPGAAVFSTFGAGDEGYVYLVRQTDELGPTQRLSRRGAIRSVAVATNDAGDALVAWDRDGTIESRLWIARSQRLTAVQALGETRAAMHLAVALGADRRATVAWVDQPVGEDGSGTNARVMATARSGSRGFLLPAKPLEVFPDPIIPGGACDRGRLHEHRPRDRRLERPHRGPRGVRRRPGRARAAGPGADRARRDAGGPRARRPGGVGERRGGRRDGRGRSDPRGAGRERRLRPDGGRRCGRVRALAVRGLRRRSALARVAGSAHRRSALGPIDNRNLLAHEPVGDEMRIGSPEQDHVQTELLRDVERALDVGAAMCPGNHFQLTIERERNRLQPHIAWHAAASALRRARYSRACCNVCLRSATAPIRL